MRLPPNLLDEIRARLPVSQIVGKRVPLKRAGREFKGLSPFKNEKTPSFTVNDEKGFYHCFATGEHGDIFTFLMQTEGISFPEAVERLADEAGVSLPKQRDYNPERETQRKTQLTLMTDAAEFFTQQLRSNSGFSAREYIAGRQLDNATVDTFGLGYAPNSRNALKEHLTKLGYAVSDMIATGMLIGGEDIATPYDRFRHRIMFPIHDLKGRIVAFGGRAMDPDQPAKYLNSPETPLFHKGSVLYNSHRARPAAYDAGEVITVEGYMDVIALAKAGFMQSVAPLGTALTSDQLAVLWRMTSEPILCFDGDAAGQKAAFRALDTALPLLQPGQSLRFAFLTSGLDPDDLIRLQGPDAMREVLDRAQPLADVLWQREWSASDWSTPERRAGLEKRLRQLVSEIQDQGVRSHYGQIIRERLDTAWNVSRPQPNQQSGRKKTYQGRSNQTRNWNSKKRGSLGARLNSSSNYMEHSRSLKQSGLVAGVGQTIPDREALLIRTLLNHPWLLDDYAEDIADLEFTSQTATRLRNGLLTIHANEIELDRSLIHNQLEVLRLGQDLELVNRIATHKSDRFAEETAETSDVEVGWRHTVALHRRQMMQSELLATEREYLDTGDEDAMTRLVELQRQIAHSLANEALLED